MNKYEMKIESTKQYELWVKDMINDRKNIPDDLRQYLIELAIESFKDGLKFTQGKLKVTIFK